MPDQKSIKILLIEDDSFLRELMSEKLRNSGYEVIEAVDGNEGLKKIQTENPALVLLDLILPGIDGFDLLREFRKELKIEVPIIVLQNLGCYFHLCLAWLLVRIHQNARINRRAFSRSGNRQPLL